MSALPTSHVRSRSTEQAGWALIAFGVHHRSSPRAGEAPAGCRLLPGQLPRRCRDISEPVQETLQRLLPVLDGGLPLLGQGARIFCRISFASISWPLLESLGA